MRPGKLFPIALFSLTAALAPILTGCHGHESSTEAGLTPVRLQLDWYPQPEHGGFYTALLKGYYKAEGLDVTLLPLPQYGSVAQLVASGKAEVGLGSSDQISGVGFKRPASCRSRGHHATRSASRHGACKFSRSMISMI